MSEDEKKLTAEELETVVGGMSVGGDMRYYVVKSKTDSYSTFWYGDIMIGVGVNLPNGTKVLAWTVYEEPRIGPGGERYMHVQETSHSQWGWMLLDDLKPA